MWSLEDVAFGILATIGYTFSLGLLYKGLKPQLPEKEITEDSAFTYCENSDKLLGNISNTDYPKKPIRKEDLSIGLDVADADGEVMTPIGEELQLITKPRDDFLFILENRFAKFLISTAQIIKFRQIFPIERDETFSSNTKTPIKVDDKPKTRFGSMLHSLRGVTRKYIPQQFTEYNSTIKETLRMRRNE